MWSKQKKIKAHDPSVKPLIQSLWGSEAASALYQPEALAYLRHYRQVACRTIPLRQPATRVVIRQTQGQSAGFIRLVDIVKKSSQKSIAEIKSAVEAANPDWLQDSHDSTILTHAVSAAVNLWLFTSLDCHDDAHTLKQALAETLPKEGKPQNDILRDDFSAKTLSRSCGFTFIWTSDLSKHLLFKPATREIHFFRHARALDHLVDSDYG